VEEVVLPEIETLKPVIAKRVFEEMKAAGVRGSKQDLQEMHSKRTVKIVC
jgi:inner membrane protein COX18